MEIFVPINYWAVLVSGIAAMVIGGVWYGPLFGKLWMKWSGFTEKDMKEAQKQGMAWRYLLNFVAALVMAYVLAHVFYYTEATNMRDGLLTAVWLWLGFIATVTLGSVLWENKPFKLYVLNNAYNLLSLIVMSTILVYWPPVLA